MFLDELRTILLEERDCGQLTTISPDLFAKILTDIRSLQQDVYSFEDPFSDEARILIEKVASIRTTIEELFKLRTDKIVGLALSQAEGSYIEREELRALIPAELEMFNQIVGAIRQGKSQLIEWKSGPGTSNRVRPQEVVKGADYNAPEAVPDLLRADNENADESTEEYQNGASFAYDIVQALSSMDSFMGVDGRTYEVQEGDILTLPSRNAQVLAERNIVLNIHPG